MLIVEIVLMIRTKKIILITIGCLAALLIILSGAVYSIKYYRVSKQAKANIIAGDPLSKRAADAYVYAAMHKMNTNYVILVDYSIPSGTPRLFVWDYKKNGIAAKCHVMHGPGLGSTDETPVFSNKMGSECSSLGKFRVTKEHGTKYERSYRLRGLQFSNYNARRRGLLIHSSKWVDRWLWKEYIPLHAVSCQGCITVSPKGLNYLEKLINSESEPLLLWSYY